MFGWLPGECLKMRARTFFSVVASAKKIQERRDCLLLAELVDVAAVGNVTDINYIKSLKKFYYDKINRLSGGKPPERQPVGPVFKADDPEAGRILLDVARQKMRLEGLN